MTPKKRKLFVLLFSALLAIDLGLVAFILHEII
jgi:hypothetical protein